MYLYDHSVQSISVNSFIGRAHHAEWDSGQVGYVYTSHADIEKEYGAVTDEALVKAENVVIAEVNLYDNYIRGECYGYKLYEGDEEIDSCWGFIGTFHEVIENLKSELPKGAVELLDGMEYGETAEEYEESIA